MLQISRVRVEFNVMDSNMKEMCGTEDDRLQRKITRYKTMFGTETYPDITELFIHAPIPWVLIHMVPIIQTNH